MIRLVRVVGAVGGGGVVDSNIESFKQEKYQHVVKARRCLHARHVKERFSARNYLVRNLLAEEDEHR